MKSMESCCLLCVSIACVGPVSGDEVGAAVVQQSQWYGRGTRHVEEKSEDKLETTEYLSVCLSLTIIRPSESNGRRSTFTAQISHKFSFWLTQIHIQNRVLENQVSSLTK